MAPYLRLAVLRPQPGNAATVARAVAAGFEAVALPLFAVEPVDWTPPDPAAHDALLLTSANALRFGGAGLAGLLALPVFAVGAHTAAAARAAGFVVAATGAGDAVSLAALAHAHGVKHALHIAGHDRTLEAGGVIAAVIPVYRSAVLPVVPAMLAQLGGTIALLHSARAARRLAALIDTRDRGATGIAAFSAAIAAAAGTGWASVAIAEHPEDQALFDAIGRMRDAAGR